MLKLFFLGPPRIESDETPIDIQRRKAMALLFYLAASERPHSRDALATLFYPDNTQQRARAYLRRDLAVINTSLGGNWLIADRESVALKQDDSLWSDIGRFREVFAAIKAHDHQPDELCPACQAGLIEAADLYADDFLVGFTLRNSPEFDDWQFFQAESLRQELALVLEQLVECMALEGNFEAAIGYARRWLSLDPLHEPVHRVLMQLYANSGQQAAALRQYEECVRLLDVEFGVPPEEETVTLFEAIKAKRIVAPLLKAETRGEPAREQSLSEARQLHKADVPPDAQKPTGTTITPAGEVKQDPDDGSRDPGTDIAHNIPLIGREAEYAKLVNALGNVTQGQSQVVLVEGESGIGKSRLIHEAVRHAKSQGIRALSGKCYEAEQSLPYQVVIHLVDQAISQWPPETLELLSPTYLAELARLVPEIAQLFPDLPPPSDLNEAQKGHLFRALTQLLSILAEQSGLILVVDDIQWADQITLQYLNYLVSHLETKSILLVGIYRSEEMATDQELMTLVELWLQEPYVDHLRLDRLTPDDAKSLARQFLKTSPTAATLGQWLYQETDGHPFFLVSILQSLGEQGLLTQSEEMEWQLKAGQLGQSQAALTLPDALRQSVHGRLRHLSKEARSVIELAAVYGRRFDFNMLQAITRADQTELLDILEDLVARQLWHEVETGRSYDFSHDKIREVVYHDLSSLRRMILHQQVAETAEKLTSGARVGLLAEQFEKGELWDKAILYLNRAAERATKLFAMGEAIGLYNRAINIVAANPGLVDTKTEFSLYECRGKARTHAGQLAGGIADLEQALEVAKTTRDQPWERALLIELGNACRKADRLEQAQHYLNEALSGERQTGNRSAVADILYHLGTISFSSGDYHQAAKYHQEAVDICSELGNVDLVAVQAYHGRGEAYFSTGHASAAIEYYKKSLDMARQIQDRSYEAEKPANACLRLPRAGRHCGV